MSKKKTYEEAVSFLKFRLENLEKQFQEASEKFIWQTTQGGGLKNIHMLETIRALNSLYLDIAAHHDALRSLKVEI